MLCYDIASLLKQSEPSGCLMHRNSVMMMGANDHCCPVRCWRWRQWWEVVTLQDEVSKALRQSFCTDCRLGPQLDSLRTKWPSQPSWQFPNPLMTTCHEPSGKLLSRGHLKMLTSRISRVYYTQCSWGHINT